MALKMDGNIYINFFSNQDFFLINFIKSVVNRKETQPEFVISAPAPQHWVESTQNKDTGKKKLPSGVTARAGPRSKNDMAQGWWRGVVASPFFPSAVVFPPPPCRSFRVSHVIWRMGRQKAPVFPSQFITPYVQYVKLSPGPPTLNLSYHYVITEHYARTGTYLRKF